MRIFVWLQLDFLDILPGECFGDFKYRLTVQAMLPLGVAAAVWLCCLLVQASSALLGPSAPGTPMKKRVLQVIEQGSLLSLPMISLVIFVSLPLISSIIFGVFDCRDYGPDVHGELLYYLETDKSVLCQVGVQLIVHRTCQNNDEHILNIF